jgi:RNA polymerase sigma-70 factor (ECF subfamily)
MAVLGSHAEADDVTQDAFVLAWRRLDSFRGDASFRTWLLTIAWRQAVNRRRSLVRWWKRTAPFGTGRC